MSGNVARFEMKGAVVVKVDCLALRAKAIIPKRGSFVKIGGIEDLGLAENSIILLADSIALVTALQRRLLTKAAEAFGQETLPSFKNSFNRTGAPLS